MADIEISKEQTGERHGRYVARIEGIDAEAEITCTKRGADLISADHTGAPETIGELALPLPWFPSWWKTHAETASGFCRYVPMSARNIASIPSGPTS